MLHPTDRVNFDLVVDDAPEGLKARGPGGSGSAGVGGSRVHLRSWPGHVPARFWPGHTRAAHPMWVRGTQRADDERQCRPAGSPDSTSAAAAASPVLLDSIDRAPPEADGSIASCSAPWCWAAASSAGVTGLTASAK